MRAGAAGVYAAEAAVELLIGHGHWLGRADFVEGFIVEADPAAAGGGLLAGIDWPAVVAGLSAGRLPCSGSEGALLRICASLTEGTAVDLGAALTGLDEANVVGVAAAIVHAGGWAAGSVPVGHPPCPLGYCPRCGEPVAFSELAGA